MKIRKIKCHQSVTFNGKENLALTSVEIPGFPGGCEITYNADLQSFHVKHKDKEVWVPKENVPFFEAEPVVETKRGRPPKSLDALIDAAL